MRAALAALALISACTSVAAPPPLTGTEWRVAAINGQATAPGGPFRMGFKAGTLSGQFGCNHFGGDYQLRGETMITGAMFMTEMACIPEGDAVDFESLGMAVMGHPMRVIWHNEQRAELVNQAGRIELRR
jgi:heat shock protein HslJ